MPSDGPVTRTPSEKARLGSMVGRALNRAGYKPYQTILRGTGALGGYKLGVGVRAREVHVSYWDGDETDDLYVQDREAYDVRVNELKVEHVALYAEALTAAGMRITYAKGDTSLTVHFDEKLTWTQVEPRRRYHAFFKGKRYELSYKGRGAAPDVGWYLEGGLDGKGHEFMSRRLPEAANEATRRIRNHDR